jgi:hypothetical protein
MRLDLVIIFTSLILSKNIFLINKKFRENKYNLYLNLNIKTKDT